MELARGRARSDPSWAEPAQALTFQLVEQHLRPLLPPAVLNELKPHFDAAATRLTKVCVFWPLVITHSD